MNEMRERLMDIINQTSIELYRSEYDELVDALIDNGVIVPPVKTGQTVWYITGIHGRLIHPAKIVEIYYNGDYFAVRVETKSGTCFDATLGRDELFLTREAAEAALKARENNA